MGPKGVLNLVANRSNERQVIQPQSVTWQTAKIAHCSKLPTSWVSSSQWTFELKCYKL